MKKTIYLLFNLAIAFIFFVSPESNQAHAQSGIYAGGPTYYNRDYSIQELKQSGFSYVVVWTIHIDASGNFNFNAEFPLVQNGAYIGDATYPNFKTDIASLKTGTTSIKRVEFGLSAWGSSTFDNIRNLINAQGTGSSSILYRNFQALKNTFPTIDAISFDDEKTYDATSATAFAVMLADLGFKVTLCPYTRSDFWTSVATNTNSQRPGTIDRIDLQCYAGGGGNSPCSWNFNGLPISAGLANSEKTSAQVQSQLTSWKNQCPDKTKGGFIWLYDELRNSSRVQEYATAINAVFGSGNGSTGVVTFYKDINYGGYAVSLPLGSYTTAALQAKGILNNDITSLQVSNGYQVTLYDADNFTGANIVRTGNVSWIGTDWNDRVSSLVISRTTSNTTSAMVQLAGAEDNILAYPNPVLEELQFHLPSHLANGNVRIIDSKGAEVVQTTLKSNVVNVSGLKPGVYIVQVTKGKYQITNRIVKQ